MEAIAWSLVGYLAPVQDSRETTVAILECSRCFALVTVTGQAGHEEAHRIKDWS